MDKRTELDCSQQTGNERRKASKEVTRERSIGKKHLLLQPPFIGGYVLTDRDRLQMHQSESLCKRMSWIVAQTIARQLVSVVNTSI
jgi:hypothetical protein